MATNFKQTTFTSKITDKEYTFQHPGIRAVSKINDTAKNKFGVVSEEKLSDEVLRLVIVNPKMKIEDFESYKEYSEVVNKAYSWIVGEDIAEDDETGSGEESAE